MFVTNTLPEPASEPALKTLFRITTSSPPCTRIVSPCMHAGSSSRHGLNVIPSIVARSLFSQIGTPESRPQRRICRCVIVPPLHRKSVDQTWIEGASPIRSMFLNTIPGTRGSHR